MLKQHSIQLSIPELQRLVAEDNDIAAFEKIYLLFYRDLHQFACNIIKSGHIAEEIVSDVFVQIWKKRATLTEVNNLRVFLYVAVKNLALTYLYKAKTQRVCWIEEFAVGAASFTDPGRADDRINEKEMAAGIQKAIDRLPLKCKAVFKLVKEDGLKYSETAKVLNLSVKTVENQMGIALKKIAQHLRLGMYMD
jgi:RNA polymerase sigma-70 factor (family 1)